MANILLHTPEGVRDIYGTECETKNKLQDILSKTLIQYGYHDIVTPTFEFFDIFNGERGTLSSKEMYKFFDREGNTLVLRPDITPSIARAAAKYYADETLPLRFSYTGNVFINNSSYQGLMKETTQMGAELVGDLSVQGDGELIALAIELLLKAGLTKFVVDIGHAGFFKALMEDAGLDESDTQQLKILIDNKNYFGIENLVESKHIRKDLKDVLIALPKLSGSVTILNTARHMTDNMEALQAIDRLESIYKIVCAYGYEKYISFDLGMLTTYDYYTGVIFRGYTYGSGDAVVKGGRYDHLVGQFGKDAPAVGFAVIIDQLLLTLNRQNIHLDICKPSCMILYKDCDFSYAVKVAQSLRKQDVLVTMIHQNKLPESVICSYCKAHNIQKIITIDGQSQIEQEV